MHESNHLRSGCFGEVIHPQGLSEAPKEVCEKPVPQLFQTWTHVSQWFPIAHLLSVIGIVAILARARRSRDDRWTPKSPRYRHAMSLAITAA